jgi:hypothetical protein
MRRNDVEMTRDAPKGTGMTWRRRRQRYALETLVGSKSDWTILKGLVLVGLSHGAIQSPPEEWIYE